MKDGGPAFPTIKSTYHAFGIKTEIQLPGLSLRDWFAGESLKGMSNSSVSGDGSKIARRAYEIADAMLAEREKKHD